MHTSGPHRNHWELKLEYKTGGQTAAGEGGGAVVAGGGGVGSGGVDEGIGADVNTEASKG